MLIFVSLNEENSLISAERLGENAPFSRPFDDDKLIVLRGHKDAGAFCVLDNGHVNHLLSISPL